MLLNERFEHVCDELLLFRHEHQCDQALFLDVGGLIHGCYSVHSKGVQWGSSLDFVMASSQTH